MYSRTIHLARLCSSRAVVSNVNTQCHFRLHRSSLCVFRDQITGPPGGVGSHWPVGIGGKTPTIVSGPHQIFTKRCYMKRKTMKILPTKPLSFDYGGDLTTEDCPLDLASPKVELDGAEKLQQVDEITSRLLSVEFADGNEKQKRRIHDLVSNVKEHPLDVQSREVIIAYQTVAIRNQIRHVLRFRKDKVSKALLVRRIQARRKHLKYLRRLDNDKFLWLCEELQIKYIPVPQYNRKASKRALLKATARNQAIQVKKDKMQDFKRKVQEEKEKFLVHKEQELKDIEQQLETLKLEDSSYLGRALRALKYGETDLMREKPDPPRSRRTIILLRKFELAAQRAKEREAAM